MGQSFVKNFVHIVFGTKHRQPLIFSPYEEALHSYIGGICASYECIPVKIGGYTDHVHILCSLSKKIAMMTLVEKIKSNSSKWMKTQDESLSNFYWQDGYGAFSVNPGDMDRLISYIANQHKHHDQKSFKEEYVQILMKHGVEYDARYVWD